MRTTFFFIILIVSLLQNDVLATPPVNFDTVPQLEKVPNQDIIDDVFDDDLEQEPDFLTKDEAFQFDFSQDGNQIQFSFVIADGYYLYKKQFKFVADNASFQTVELPKGIPYQDEFFGATEIYKKKITITIPFNFALENGLLKIRYQGCAEAGLCYPPSIKQIPLDLINSTGVANNNQLNSSFDDSESGLNSFLQQQAWYITLVVFFVLGIGLSLTPCVFPMYPILSSIIAGQTKLSSRQALLLSVTFVQGMALTYSLLGLVAAYAGASFQAILQSEIVLIILSLMFIGLAASMFGFYELSLPSSWVNKLNQQSQQQTQGKLTGVFMMGILSGLIASPCTTAPLSGALLYVAQTGDLFFGFITLYILSLGMGLPLLIIGASAGKWLPKAGMWMESVKKLFAFLLLAVPIMLLARFLSELVILWLAIALSSLTSIYFIVQVSKKQAQKLNASIAVIAIVINGYFIMLVSQYQILELPFSKITQVSELNLALDQAKKNQKMVLLDITADWCVGCKEFEHLTFADKSVQEAFAQYTWLQLDVTEFNQEHDAFIKSFNIIGPPAPTVIIIDKTGSEMTDKRIRGFLAPKAFIEKLNP